MSTTSSTSPSTGPSTNSSSSPSNARSASQANARAPRQRSPRSDSRASTCCTFTFSDGRQCRIPRRQGHPYLCVFHAKKEARSLAGEQAGRDIASFLSGDYISASDVASALARLFSAVAQGHIKPKTAATLAYLGQTLVQTVKLAEHEYANAFGPTAWRDAIRSSFAPPPAPTPRPAPPPHTQPTHSAPVPPSPPPPAAPTPSVTQPQSAAGAQSRGTIHRALFAAPSPNLGTNQPLGSPAPVCHPDQSAAGAPQVSPARKRWVTRRARHQHRRCATNSWLPARRIMRKSAAR
jgi:hypothetical protein